MFKLDTAKILEYLRAGIQSNQRVTLRRVVAISSVLHLLIGVFLFFAFYNYFITKLRWVAIMDVIATFGIFGSLLDLYKNKNIQRSAAMATFFAMIFLTVFILINGADHFGLIWVVYFPIFAIIANGRKRGLIFSVAFLAFVYVIAYFNIGIWNYGHWNGMDFFRLVFATSVLTYTFYVLEYSQEKSDAEIDEIRSQERMINEKLKEMSVTDSLTGLYNRRFFNENMPKLFNLAHREKMCLAFFILDVDNFKNYNDTYGHKKGDEVLKRIADTIKKYVQRQSDYVFRLGGEEFGGAILTHSKEETQKHIDQLCRKIRDLKIPHEAAEHAEKIVTVSIGVYMTCPDDGESLENIFKQADMQLYKAKREGKDRISVKDRCK